jgi:hypothetical protein
MRRRLFIEWVLSADFIVSANFSASVVVVDELTPPMYLWHPNLGASYRHEAGLHLICENSHGYLFFYFILEFSS